MRGLLVVFFMNCESGSGAFLDAQDVSVGFGWAVLRWGMGWLGSAGGSVTIWHGLSDLVCWMRRELCLAPSAKFLQCSGMFMSVC
jgi:hypothetical protein